MWPAAMAMPAADPDLPQHHHKHHHHHHRNEVKPAWREPVASTDNQFLDLSTMMRPTDVAFNPVVPFVNMPSDSRSAPADQPSVSINDLAKAAFDKLGYRDTSSVASDLSGDAVKQDSVNPSDIFSAPPPRFPAIMARPMPGGDIPGGDRPMTHDLNDEVDEASDEEAFKQYYLPKPAKQGPHHVHHKKKAKDASDLPQPDAVSELGNGGGDTDYPPELKKHKQTNPKAQQASQKEEQDNDDEIQRKHHKNHHRSHHQRGAHHSQKNNLDLHQKEDERLQFLVQQDADAGFNASSISLIGAQANATDSPSAEQSAPTQSASPPDGSAADNAVIAEMSRQMTEMKKTMEAMQKKMRNGGQSTSKDDYGNGFQEGFKEGYSYGFHEGSTKLKDSEGPPAQVPGAGQKALDSMKEQVKQQYEKSKPGAELIPPPPSKAASQASTHASLVNLLSASPALAAPSTPVAVGAAAPVEVAPAPQMAPASPQPIGQMDISSLLANNQDLISSMASLIAAPSSINAVAKSGQGLDKLLAGLGQPARAGTSASLASITNLLQTQAPPEQPTPEISPTTAYGGNIAGLAHKGDPISDLARGLPLGLNSVFGGGSLGNKAGASLNSLLGGTGVAPASTVKNTQTAEADRIMQSLMGLAAGGRPSAGGIVPSGIGSAILRSSSSEVDNLLASLQGSSNIPRNNIDSDNLIGAIPAMESKALTMIGESDMKNTQLTEKDDAQQLLKDAASSML